MNQKTQPLQKKKQLERLPDNGNGNGNDFILRG